MGLRTNGYKSKTQVGGKRHFFFKVTSKPIVGLEPLTLRSRVGGSTNFTSQAPQPCFKIDVEYNTVCESLYNYCTGFMDLKTCTKLVKPTQQVRNWVHLPLGEEGEGNSS